MENARAFTNRLADLLARERTALADFLVALADFDQRRLWMALGYASLFDFLHRELGLSKTSASFRKKAAELIQQFPEIEGPLRDGRLCLTSVFELGKVLTAENRAEVLPRFFQLSRREAKTVAAELRPQDAPARREVVTAVCLPEVPAAGALLAVSTPHPVATSVTTSEVTAVNAVCPVKPADANGERASHRSPHPASASRPSTEPLTAELNRLHVTVSRRFLQKLEAARAALSHSHPGAGMEEILEAGLDLVLERSAKRKGLVKRPRSEPRPSRPGHVPAHVLRAVWERDGGRCQWELASGGICGSTLRVEVDHRVARARGGPATVENLRCLCRPHNLLAARRAFGAWVERYARRRAAPGGPPPGDWAAARSPP